MILYHQNYVAAYVIRHRYFFVGQSLMVLGIAPAPEPPEGGTGGNAIVLNFGFSNGVQIF